MDKASEKFLHVDKILVMDHGRIVERGRHGELLRRLGLYRRLWDLQNQILLDMELPSLATISQY